MECYEEDKGWCLEERMQYHDKRKVVGEEIRKVSLPLKKNCVQSSNYGQFPEEDDLSAPATSSIFEWKMSGRN
jgi:hypothetical protein